MVTKEKQVRMIVIANLKGLHSAHIVRSPLAKKFEVVDGSVWDFVQELVGKSRNYRKRMNSNGINKYVLLVPLWLTAIFIFEWISIRAFSLRYDLIFSALKYFVVTVLVLRYIPKECKIYLIVANVFLCIFIALAAYEFLYKERIVTIGWPSMVMGILGMWAAVLFYKYRQSSAKWIVAAGLYGVIFLGYRSYPHINLFNQEGRLSGRISTAISYEDITLTDEFGNIQTFHPDTLYILDVWYSGCGVCFKEFPNFNKKMLENKNPKIRYISVNKPIEEDDERAAFDLLKKYNYSFPVWKGNPEINEAFGVEVYPTIVAVHNNTLLFRGNLGLLDKFLEDFERGK